MGRLSRPAPAASGSGAGAAPSRLHRWGPTLVVLLLAAAYLGWVLAAAGGDPLVFASLGTRYGGLDSTGSEGYDGQFNYYIAADPVPARIAPHLDVPAYRYQHILYPLFARLLALGRPAALPWTLLAVNLLCLTGFTFVAGELIVLRGGNRWWSLPVGLWAGLIGAVRLDLSEPSALLLTALALWSAGPELDRRPAAAAILLALALFAKETMVPFVGGWFAWLLWKKDFGKAAWIAAATAPFAVFQIWLWSVFGSPGIGSGGAGSTPFEWIPFAGFLRIAAASLPAFAALAVVYLPGLLLPAAFGLVRPALDFLRRRATPEAALLFANAAMIACAPFSTFREPLGILRLACGLILCLWLYALANGIDWWKKLGLAGWAYLAFLR
jgi:hypothetical protein